MEVLERTTISDEYMDKLVNEGGNVWFSRWVGKEKATTFGLRFVPRDKGGYSLELVYWTVPAKKKAQPEERAVRRASRRVE